MSSFTGLFSSGGGLKPKFQEFTSSGTFTPSQELIDAGGYIEVFLVGGGANGQTTILGGGGGETILKTMYLTSTTGISVTIGAGANDGTNGNDGGNSSFTGSSAGGSDLTAKGGRKDARQISSFGSGWGTYMRDTRVSFSSGSGLFGYGVGGGGADFSTSKYGGADTAPANSGHGVANNNFGGSGYCLVKWYE